MTQKELFDIHMNVINEVPSCGVIANPSLSVILSEAKNLAQGKLREAIP